MLTFLADFGAVNANVFDMVFFKNRPGFGAGASAATLVARARIPRPIWSGWRSIILVYIFKKKLNGSRRGRRIEQRCAISAAWRRERDAGTVYFENAFANEEQPAIYMHDDRIGLVVCPMFALRPDHRVERARLRAAGAYAFS